MLSAALILCHSLLFIAVLLLLLLAMIEEAKRTMSSPVRSGSGRRIRQAWVKATTWRPPKSNFRWPVDVLIDTGAQGRKLCTRIFRSLEIQEWGQSTINAKGKGLLRAANRNQSGHPSTKHRWVVRHSAGVHNGRPSYYRTITCELKRSSRAPNPRIDS